MIAAEAPVLTPVPREWRKLKTKTNETKQNQFSFFFLKQKLFTPE
jgi:hypothetical protein